MFQWETTALTLTIQHAFCVANVLLFIKRANIKASHLCKVDSVNLSYGSLVG